MRHPVMWFEVLGQDANGLCQFYGSLFGWTFAGDKATYGMVAQPPRGIPGGIGKTYPGARAWVTFYVETPDVAASLADAQRLGGKVVMPRTSLPDVTIGVFEDPEGHTIGLVEAKAA